MVGTARLLSDGVCNAYLLDVWTAAAYRRRGIASAMIERLVDEVPGQHVGLQTDSAQPLYESLGLQHPAGVLVARRRHLARERREPLALVHPEGAEGRRGAAPLRSTPGYPVLAASMSPSLLLGREDEEEGVGGDGGAEEVGEEVDPDVAPLEQPGHHRAERDRGVEGAARDAADRERAGDDREADREAVEGVALRPARRRDVQDDPGEREREEELDDQHLPGARDEGVRLAAADVAHDEAREHRGGELGERRTRRTRSRPSSRAGTPPCSPPG